MGAGPWPGSFAGSSTQSPTAGYSPPLAASRRRTPDGSASTSASAVATSAPPRWATITRAGVPSPGRDVRRPFVVPAEVGEAVWIGGRNRG